MSKEIDPKSDLKSLQNQFHSYVLDSFNGVNHDLLSIYVNFISINPEFVPSFETINKVSHAIRFNKIKSDINLYSFILEIQPDFSNTKLKQSLILFSRIYSAKIKDYQRTREFHNWLNRDDEQ